MLLGSVTKLNTVKKLIELSITELSKLYVIKPNVMTLKIISSVILQNLNYII